LISKKVSRKKEAVEIFGRNCCVAKAAILIKTYLKAHFGKWRYKRKQIPLNQEKNIKNSEELKG
jgi:hypothetical protein